MKCTLLSELKKLDSLSIIAEIVATNGERVVWFPCRLYTNLPASVSIK